MKIIRIIYRKLYSLFAPLYLSQDRRYSQYDIGSYTYGKPKVLEWTEGTTLRIGRFCSISTNVTILLGGDHRTDWVSSYPFSAIFKDAKGFVGHPLSKGDVVIGNDVWIGTEAMILIGVNIGNGAVIAARAMVARDVPPYAIVAGIPARLVKYRFDDETITALQKISWWDWQIGEIKAAWPLLLSNNISAFTEKYADDR